MLRLLIGLFFSVYSVSLLQAQDPVGHYFDINGEYIDGYLDPFSYAPVNFLNITYKADEYERGIYYTKDNQGVSGLIKFDEKVIKFKSHKEDDFIKLTPAMVSGLKIGADSFFVANNFQVQRSAALVTRTSPEFFQYLGETKNYVFAKHYFFTSEVRHASVPPVFITYQVKEKGGVVWKAFVNNDKKFRQLVSSVFKDVPTIVERVNARKLDNGDMMTLIKTALYWDKFNRKERIFFDQYWNEITDESKHVYSAEITNLSDSIWDFSYFKEGVKRYDVQYSSFYPNRKNGRCISYHLNGSKRREVNYRNDEAKGMAHYNEAGEVNMEYALISRKTDFETIRMRRFTKLNGQNEVNKSVVGQNLTHEFYDDFSKRTLKMSLDGTIPSAIYVVEGGISYQSIFDLNYRFKTKALQRELSYIYSDIDFLESSEQNVQGIILIVVRIDSKGKLVSAKRLNGLSDEVNEVVDELLSSKLNVLADYPLRFKPYKLNNEKVPLEVVIPIVFNVSRFYRRPSNYYNNSFMFQHHMMMNQMNTFTPTITPPTFSAPSF